MKRLALCLLLTACASPHRPSMVWTENGYMTYDAQPGHRARAEYNDAARLSMGIPKRQRDAAQRKADYNQWAWEQTHPRFATRNQVRDRALELALERDTRP